jgi:flagellin
LYAITEETFNSVTLFSAESSKVFGTDTINVTIFTSDRGGSGAVVSLSKGLLISAMKFADITSATPYTNAAANATATATTNIGFANESGSEIEMDKLSLGFFRSAIENIASLRATNAAGMARLQLAEDHVRLTMSNLEAANSRIMDVDVAAESTRFAKYNILSQASAAMLAQANQAPSTALMLL